jgi:AcrR family transcriptional regulator
MNGRTRAKGPGRLRAQDWVEAAYAAMAEGGVGAVAVEPLARRLGVTRGSFYWHFEDRRSLIEAVLKRWEEEATEATISATGRIPDPRERLVRLAEEAFGEVPRDDESFGGTVLRRRAFDLAVSDAAEDPIVRPFLRRVTERRIGYLEECYRELGLPSEKARHMALLAYTAQAGTVRLLRDLPERIPRGDAYLSYRRHLVETLIPQDAEGGTRGG